MTYQSECCGKVRYRDRKSAKAAVRQMRGHGRQARTRLKEYPCSWCPFFHVGNFQINSRLAARVRRAATNN